MNILFICCLYNIQSSELFWIWHNNNENKRMMLIFWYFISENSYKYRYYFLVVNTWNRVMAVGSNRALCHLRRNLVPLLSLHSRRAILCSWIGHHRIYLRAPATQVGKWLWWIVRFRSARGSCQPLLYDVEHPMPKIIDKFSSHSIVIGMKIRKMLKLKKNTWSISSNR